MDEQAHSCLPAGGRILGFINRSANKLTEAYVRGVSYVTDGTEQSLQACTVHTGRSDASGYGTELTAACTLRGCGATQLSIQVY